MPFSKHIAIAHDSPQLEDDLHSEIKKATANVSTSTVVKLLWYKIFDPVNAVIVKFCSKGIPNTTCISLKASVAIPVTLNVSEYPVSEQGLLVSNIHHPHALPKQKLKILGIRYMHQKCVLLLWTQC